MPFNRLSTTKIAKAVGCHPNTVRLYEQIGFISPVLRSPKGYRLYTEAHLDQMRLARLGMEGPWPGPNIRRVIVAVIRASAAQDYPTALELARLHQTVVRAERRQAEAATDFLHHWMTGQQNQDPVPALQIKQVAKLLNITNDTLRSWERNGLVTVPRSQSNRYRQYGAPEIGRLRVIRLLRQSGFSPMAILRMLVQLDHGSAGRQLSAADVRQALDTPRPDEDAAAAADRWLSSLAWFEQRAQAMIDLLEQMVHKYTPSSSAN